MSDFAIRMLTSGDLEGALRLSSTAGWNQREADWRMLLGIAPRGGFAAVDQRDGRIVGTSIGIDYGSFGWVAMMLVDPACRGRGLGARLLEAAMDAVPPDRPIRLDATPMGRPLYRRYGFVDEVALTRHVADDASRPTAFPAGGGAGGSDVRSLNASDFATVADCDRQVFGGNRLAVLEWALQTAPQYATIALRASDAPQYCLGREGRLFDQIGPVVARDGEVARALLAKALTAAGARSIVVDLFDAHLEIAAWLRGRGFRPERPLYRMRRPRPTAADEASALNGDTVASPLKADHVASAFSRTNLQEFAIFGPEFA